MRKIGRSGFRFPKREAHVTPDRGPLDDVVEKRALRNYGTLSHVRIYHISLSERLRGTGKRYIRKLRMRLLYAKSCQFCFN